MELRYLLCDRNARRSTTIYIDYSVVVYQHAFFGYLYLQTMH